MRTVAFCIVILSLWALSEASHGRFGTISWTQSPSNPLEVTFSVNIVWRRTYFGAPNVGDTIDDVQIVFGDGGYDYPAFTVSAINTQDDWLAATWVGTHTYGSTGDYNANIASCCRIFALNNNPSYSYQFSTRVRLTGTVNNSPVSNMLPIISVPLGVSGFQYQLLASDPEGGALAFSMASVQQMGDGSSTHPPGLSVSSSGLVTIAGALSSGYWTTQQVVTDSVGNYIVVDYLLLVEQQQKFCNGTCQASAQVCTSAADCVACNADCLTATPRIVLDGLTSSNTPRTNYPAPAAGSTVNVPTGQTTVVGFVVDDSQLTNPATAPFIYTTAVPTYGVASSAMDCTAANGCTYIGSFQKPQFITLTLNPTSADAGDQVVCVGAESLGNAMLAQHCVTFRVAAAPSAVCGNGIVETGEDCEGGVCCDATCHFASSATVCRAKNGVCDAAETCTGSSSSCPTDVFASATTVCRPQNGTCDEAETCTGSSTSCPIDGVKQTTYCMSASQVCPRVSNTTSGTQQFLCNQINRNSYFSCYTQVSNGVTYPTYTNMPCAGGTQCNCPYGVDCSCGGTISPCSTGGVIPPCAQ